MTRSAQPPEPASNSDGPDTGEQTTGGLRVALAEDDVLLREGLASLFERSGFAVVGQAATVRNFSRWSAKPARPGGSRHADAAQPTRPKGSRRPWMIRAERPEIAILLLSAYVDVEHAMELLASGRAIGYLLKSRITNVEDFLDTVHRVAEGGSVVDPALVQELVTARRRDDPLAVLSAREVEVLALMAEGRSNRGIAKRLGSPKGPLRSTSGASSPS